MDNQNVAILLLADGTCFYGVSIGAKGSIYGELCFNTGMTGYQEIFTDPSYTGQLLVTTHVHIGNYGINYSEQESGKVCISGLICKNLEEKPSRQQSDNDIHDFLRVHNIVGISNVDTRQIVRYIRENGAMNAVISTEFSDLDGLLKSLKKQPTMDGLELASVVCTDVPYFVGKADAKFKVAVMDFGVKRNILENFLDRDCYLQVFPAKTSFSEIQKWNPDGYFLSNGPGDPSVMQYAVETTKSILESKKPVFGICLGHQIIARTFGIDTYKMHNGHRGINHPVKNLETGKCEVTSQNHGFVVKIEDIKNHKDLLLTHVNLNDETVEGMRVKNENIFSVQYHPESSPGPHDSRYLFDDFVILLEKTILVN